MRSVSWAPVGGSVIAVLLVAGCGKGTSESAPPAKDVVVSNLVQNPNFDFVTPDHTTGDGRGHYVNINDANTPSWVPSASAGNKPFTAIASDPQSIFVMKEFPNYLQIQTSGPARAQDLYQRVVISQAGTYTLAARAETRKDSVNNNGDVILELWSGSLSDFSAGSPIKPDSAVSPPLNATFQTYSRAYALAAGTYTVQVGGISKAGGIFQAAVDAVSLTGLVKAPAQ